MEHTEVLVKVNAWVDEGIVPLVKAFNECPWVWTLDSCQGSDTAPAHIYFRIVEDPHLGFICFLARALERVVGEAYWWEIEATWSSTRWIVRLSLEPNQIEAMSREVERISKGWIDAMEKATDQIAKG